MGRVHHGGMSDTDSEYPPWADGMPRAWFDNAVTNLGPAYREEGEQRAAAYRLAWSGPSPTARGIGKTFRIPLVALGFAAPALAIDGHAYRRRQKNRAKRRRS